MMLPLELVLQRHDNIVDYFLAQNLALKTIEELNLQPVTTDQHVVAADGRASLRVK